MLEYLDFIRENWKLIACTWEDRDQCLYDNLSGYGYDNFIWCCGFASGFMLDIFKAYDRPFQRRESHLVRKIEDVQLEPGFIYEFEISNHVFCVLYHPDATLYYIDYFVETGRDEPFRLEAMNLSELMEYFSGYINEDFRVYQRFNKSTLEHVEAARKDYYFDKQIEKKPYMMSYTKHQITIEPTVESVIETIVDSGSPIEEIEDCDSEGFQERLSLIEKF